MKTPALLLVFALATILGCASSDRNALQAQPPHNPRMTEAEAIAVAQRLGPLPENGSYQAVYDKGTWKVMDKPGPGGIFTWRSFKMVLIRDKDGAILGWTQY